MIGISKPSVTYHQAPRGQRQNSSRTIARSTSLLRIPGIVCLESRKSTPLSPFYNDCTVRYFIVVYTSTLLRTVPYYVKLYSSTRVDTGLQQYLLYRYLYFRHRLVSVLSVFTIYPYMGY